jgi:hypothetical protein
MDTMIDEAPRAEERPAPDREPRRPPQDRPKKRIVNGWVILDKPVGMTSTHAVSVVKRLFTAKRAGHAGTLDPLASGLLPIALGEATKTVPFVMDGRKTYAFTVRWGEERDTDDAEGRVAASSDARPTADEIRALLPPGTQNVRLPIWSPVVDRDKLVQLAKYAKEFGVIPSLPNMARLVPSSVVGGKVLQGTIGNVFITLRLDGRPVARLPHGRYTIVVTDNSSKTGFRLAGPGVKKQTSVKGRGRSTWTLTLKKGRYVYSSITHPRRHRVLRVT